MTTVYAIKSGPRWDDGSWPHHQEMYLTHLERWKDDWVTSVFEQHWQYGIGPELKLFDSRRKAGVTASYLQKVAERDARHPSYSPLIEVVELDSNDECLQDYV